jgi:soluble lytic murein transglycosylase-like protein
VRKKLIALMIADIAEDVFESREHQEYWISLIGVESGYQGTAKSSTGAIGLGQLIPSYRADFGRDCGLTEVDRADLDDDFTNAYLSACYFRTMIVNNAGSIPLAFVAYNAGPYSKDLKKAKAGASPSLEPSAYTTRALIHKDKASK